MPRSQGVNPNPNNTNREIGIYNHSLTYEGSGGRGGSTRQVTTSRDYVLVTNYQTSETSLYATGTLGERGDPVATKAANGRWKVTQTSALTANEKKALEKSLTAGQFGKKLNTELKEVATRDLGNDQYKRKYNPSTTQTSEEESTSGGGANGAGGNSGGSGIPSTPKGQESLQSVISSGTKARTKYDQQKLKYPETYNGNDYLSIKMIRYVPENNLGLGKNPESTNDNQSFTFDGGGVRRFSERLGKDQEKKVVLASIDLPIPSNLVDGNLVNWANQDLPAIQAYGVGAAARLMTSGGNLGNALSQETKRLGTAVQANADAIKTLVTTGIIAQILQTGGGLNPLLARSTGAILNPNQELLFNGPQLRTFTFNFKMTPRSIKEAESVKKIIRTFKQGMSVKRAAGGVFLATPNVFELEFKYIPPGEKTSAQRHPFLPILKVCALQNISVNYMPDGSYMTYGDGSMIGYDMTLTFGELEPIFDEDYTKLDDDQDKVIGY